MTLARCMRTRVWIMDYRHGHLKSRWARFPGLEMDRPVQEEIMDGWDRVSLSIDGLE